MDQPVIVARRSDGSWFLVLEGLPPDLASTIPQDVWGHPGNLWTMDKNAIWSMDSTVKAVLQQAEDNARHMPQGLGVDPTVLKVVDATNEYWRDVCQSSIDMSVMYTETAQLRKHCFSLDPTTFV
jgi:hypothetical protein